MFRLPHQCSEPSVGCKRIGVKPWVGRLAVHSVLTMNILACLFITSFFPWLGHAGNDDDLYKELETFTDVLTIVQNDYVQEVKSTQLVEGAIKGMLTSLDPHSGYLDLEYFKEMQVQTKGEFGGLGIEITMRDGVIIVVSPMEDSPAARAGIKPGDAIVKIDGTFTKDLNLMDAVRRLRGPKGTEVVLSIHRKTLTGLFEIPLRREAIQVKSVKSRYLGDGIGLVRINQFMESTADDLKTALRRFHDQSGDLKGLVLDLRNNPGGLLNQAVKVSDMFLSEGVIVYTESRVDSQKQRFFAHTRGTEPDYPIVVLVNGGSASASEIVAGALKDHGRAVIVGNQTFGKGSVQTVSPLRNGGALSLTTALYFTKSGRSIQLTGVLPDIEVAVPVVDPARGKKIISAPHLLREGDLPGAIKNPSGIEVNKPAVSPTLTEDELEDLKPLDIESAPVAEMTSKDPYLSRGLEILKSYVVVPEAKVAA